MLFHRKANQNRCPSLMGQLALAGALLFPSLPGLAATPGQLLPKPGDTAAQQSETSQATKSPTPSAVPVAEPIPLGDVAKRLESSRRQIREVGEKVQPPEVAEIAKEIEGTRGILLLRRRRARTPRSPSRCGRRNFQTSNLPGRTGRPGLSKPNRQSLGGRASSTGISLSSIRKNRRGN